MTKEKILNRVQNDREKTMNINLDQIKKLREETGAGIADCREALSETNGDMAKAKDYLKKKGFDKAASKSDREVKAGLVEAYSHGGKAGVLVTLLCETDFVAKTEDFKYLAHELALQIVSMKPENGEELMQEEYIRDTSLTVGDLIKSYIAKLGENIQVASFTRATLDGK